MCFPLKVIPVGLQISRDHRNIPVAVSLLQHQLLNSDTDLLYFLCRIDCFRDLNLMFLPLFLPDYRRIAEQILLQMCQHFTVSKTRKRRISDKDILFSSYICLPCQTAQILHCLFAQIKQLLLASHPKGILSNINCY